MVNNLKDIQVAKLDFMLEVPTDMDKFCRLSISNRTYFTNLDGVVDFCNNLRIGILLMDSTANCATYEDILKKLGLKSYIVPVSFAGMRFKWLSDSNEPN